MSENQTELRKEIEALRRSTIARESVMEQIITNLIVHLSQRFDPDSRMIHAIMISTEDALRNAQRHAPDEVRETANDAVAYFEDYSARLIAAITPRDKPQ